MSRGYSCCSACEDRDGNSGACFECYNGDLFSTGYDYGNNDCKAIMYSKQELEHIKKLKERDSKKKVEIKISNGYERYYCPSCGKQQKVTYKNRHEGCFCERCGQRLAPFSS